MPSWRHLPGKAGGSYPLHGGPFASEVHRLETTLALLLKHTLGFFLAAVWEDKRILLTWSDLDRPFCIAARDAAFQRASDVITSEEEWTSRDPEQGVNLIQKH